MDYDLLQRVVEFDDLCELFQHPLGVDPTRESVAELYARWRELRRLGLDIDPAVETYLRRTRARLDEV